MQATMRVKRKLLPPLGSEVAERLFQQHKYGYFIQYAYPDNVFYLHGISNFRSILYEAMGGKTYVIV